MIESKNNPGLHGDAMRMDGVDNPGKLFHPIEPLIHSGHAWLGDRLQSHEQLLASAMSRKLQEFVIPAGMNAHLAAPPLAIGSDGAK